MTPVVMSTVLGSDELKVACLPPLMVPPAVMVPFRSDCTFELSNVTEIPRQRCRIQWRVCRGADQPVAALGEHVDVAERRRNGDAVVDLGGVLKVGVGDPDRE